MAMNEMWGDSGVAAERTPAEKARWFTMAKYAMFIHWGLYSQAGNRWEGRQYHGISEWLMWCRRIPVRDYERLAAAFNPVDFDAGKWVALARAAGMRYIVLTAKHHEGFAMFKSAHPFNIVDATPFGRDPLAELALACREAGIGLGVYYSQFQDWHEINDWDPEGGNLSFEEYFETKCLVQVRELLSNYGPLAMIWFDTPGAMTLEQSQRIVDLMRELQPGAMINSRIGNGVGEYSTLGDHELPLRRLPGLWESIDTTNDSWGFAGDDRNWLESDEILRRLVGVVARGGNYMLNLGPDGRGSFPPLIVRSLLRAGEWTARHAEALYGASPSPWEHGQPWGDCTCAGSRLFCHVFDWRPGAVLRLHGLGNRIEAVRWDGRELAWRAADGWLSIELPLERAREPIEVITVEVDGLPRQAGGIGIDPALPTRLPAAFAATSGCEIRHFNWMERFGEWKHVDAVTGWREDGRAEWTVEVPADGEYIVALEYDRVRHRCWEIAAGDDRLEFWARDAGDGGEVRRYKCFRAGVMTLKAGTRTLAVRPVSDPESAWEGDGMELAAVVLRRYE